MSPNTLKKLRQAADELGKDGTTDRVREASRLVHTIANALEHGSAYDVTAFAQAFDAANAAQCQKLENFGLKLP